MFQDKVTIEQGFEKNRSSPGIISEEGYSRRKSNIRWHGHKFEIIKHEKTLSHLFVKLTLNVTGLMTMPIKHVGNHITFIKRIIFIVEYSLSPLTLNKKYLIYDSHLIKILFLSFIL